MSAWLTALLLFAQLGAPFVDATATGTRVGDRIEVNLEVEVEALNLSTVLAHIADPGGEQVSVPLNERSDGRYGAVVTLPAADLVVVFEALAPGDSVLSQPMTLTALGLDPAILAPDRPFATVEPEDDSVRLTPSTRRWGWAAVGLVAAALALLAFWAAGPRRGHSGAGAPDSPGGVSGGAERSPDVAGPDVAGPGGSVGDGSATGDR